MARNTNDLSLAYAHARRELSCRYTLGFYDERPEEERSHDVRVRVKRPGLRVSYPGGYAFRSEEKKRTSLLTAAFIAPAMFENGFVRVHIFPIKPTGKRTWDCRVALEFPLPVKDGETVERQFAVFVRKDSRKVTSFDRRIQVKAGEGNGGLRRVSFSQPVELLAGTYTVTAIVGDPERERPYASSAQVVVPPVPDGDVFLVPPVLGRQAMHDVVVQAMADDARKKTSDELAKDDRVGDAGTFMPLLVQSVTPADRVMVMTQVCAKGRGAADPGRSISRAIDAESGTAAFRWDDAPLEIEAGEGLTCEPLLEVLPIAYLSPGDYVFRASLGKEGRKDPVPLAVPFIVEAGRTP
ncbi:MAG: hypothetical protein ACREAA_18910 [Candidatus Polarisedimenticolia bacterium]